MLGWFKRSRVNPAADSEALASRVRVGFEAHGAGDTETARSVYESVLRESPGHADANYLIGVLDMTAGRLEAALARFDRAIASGKPTGSFHFSRGEVLRALDRLAEATHEFETALRLPDPDAEWAVELGRTREATGDRAGAADAYRRAVDLDSAGAPAWWHLGAVLEKDGALDEAEIAYRNALERAPGHLPARLGLADVHRRRGEADKALAMYQEILEGADGHVGAAINLTGLLVDGKRFAEAEQVARSNLERFGGAPDLWLNLGTALMGQDRGADARVAFQTAVDLDGAHWRARMQLAVALEHAGEVQAAESQLYEVLALADQEPEPHFVLAGVLRRQSAFGEAEAEFRRALELKPDFGAAWINYAEMLQKTARIEAAAGALEHAVKAVPDMPEAHMNRGTVLLHLGRFEEAEACLLRAIELQPELRGAWITLGAVYLLGSKLTESEQACRKVLEKTPDDADALSNLGICLQLQGRIADAVEVTRRAIEARSDFATAWSNLLMNQNYSDAVDARALYSEHQRFGAKFPPRRERAYFRDRLPLEGRKLRVGYVSPDFRNHVVSMFFETVLDAHDRSAWEIYCYHNDNRVDEVTHRLRASADLWRDIASLSDDEAEARLLEDRLDIVVDLAGHTAGNRLPLFGRRVAPVQVTWLGYPNTTGLASMDWRITDALADPEGLADEIHTERLCRMPEVFLAYRPRAEAPAVTATPAVENGYVTFGSFNNFAKVSDSVIRLWGEIMRAVPDARLAMKTMSLRDADVQKALFERLDRLGCDVKRVTLSGMIPGLANHLASLSRVDIALDAFPYHGTTTTCECLWMGVPVVSLAGDRHASRVGVSLLTAVGARDLIAESPDAYVRKAVALARDRTSLEFWRRELRPRMAASPLTDHVRYAGMLETAYRRMLEQWRREC